jgi:hypothetical protein
VRESLLHRVIGVSGGHVETSYQLVVGDCRTLVRDTGRDELVRSRVLADDVGLPGDELSGLVCLELPPRHVVLRLHVAVGRPQIGPVRQSVGPVHESPLVVERLHVAVPVPQAVHEPLEHPAVVQQLVPGLVVDLEPDHRRMTGVPLGDPADHPLGVEPEAGMGEVDLLSRAPADALTCPPLTGDLRIEPRQPRRYGVRRGAEQDRDVTFVGTVEDGLQPVQLEAPVLRLPGGPDRLPHPDHREVGRGHLIEILLETILRLVLVVVRSSEEHTFVHNFSNGRREN